MMNFHLVNLGCKVNKVESDDAAAYLIDAGWSFSPANEADIILVNTCTVTGEADKKTRKAVRHALSVNSQADVIVTGCAAAVNPRFFEALDDRVRVVPKADFLLTVEEIIENHGGLRSAIKSLRMGDGFRTRVGVKVQDGCDNACTYCIVHVARGRATSRPVDDVVAECVAYAREGVREIVLAGINIGSYSYVASSDEPCVMLADLLKRLMRETALGEGAEPRFRISSIEPCDISDDLIALMAESDGRICRHLHIPLQSGSSRVLSEMNRPYDAVSYANLVSKLRTAMPLISLSTDIIVGFPGETDSDFEDTLSLSESCGFSRIHVFPYSRREGTPAAERFDQVPPEIKSARAAQLRELARELRKDDRALREGLVEWCLVETGGVAMSESYHEVDAPDGSVVGDLIAVEL